MSTGGAASVTAMDVDSPAIQGGLKRCSSAPTINDNGGGSMTASPTANQTHREPLNLFSNTNQFRMRRFSASSCTPICGSPNSALRLTPRITQLRQEEYADTCNTREVAHEREVHSTMQISQSWEDLRLVGDSPTGGVESRMTPLDVSVPPYSMQMGSSPSPTRIGSPGFQSPKRCTLIRRQRSASPSPILRASPLGVKRKLDEDNYHLSPRSKRFHSYDHSGLLTTSTGSVSSVGTPESTSSADSPGFGMSPSPGRVLPMSKADQDMTDSNG